MTELLKKTRESKKKPGSKVISDEIALYMVTATYLKHHQNILRFP